MNLSGLDSAGREIEMSNREWRVELFRLLEDLNRRMDDLESALDDIETRLPEPAED